MPTVMLKYFLACGIAVAILPTFQSANAKDGFVILHTFRGGSDGAYPSAGLIADQAGNLYGTTELGGNPNCSEGAGYGCGTVFKITPDGQETVLYGFAGGNSDGAYPLGSLIADQVGNLYGTTSEGGGSGCIGRMGCGSVFKIAPDGTETILHLFGGGDGARPYAGLVEDGAGNLYGTTYVGGAGCNRTGCGTVFEIANDGTETVLHAFGGRDGKFPLASLIFDNAGNLNGTTYAGGKGAQCDRHCGTAFSLANGEIHTLHSFVGGSDGEYPETELTADQAGNLYGTTVAGGGNTGCGHSFGCGTLFKIAPDGTETVLYAFCKSAGCPDGFFPLSGLIQDHHGNLYGATSGQGACGGCSAVFKFAPDGMLKVLHTFRARRDGAYPAGKLLMAQAGYLYGTAGDGGRGYGTVFKLRM